MIAHATREKPVRRAQPRHEDRARVPGPTGADGTAFDVHRWLEHYRACHDDAHSSDVLAGVPFN